MESHNGTILKGIGGFYYVESDNKVYECKARGIFRQKNLKPLAGDKVKFELANNTCTITDILDRKNSLIRPPIANVDNLIIVSSICEPKVNTLIIDKMIALATYKKINPIVIISKSDLDDGMWLKEIYDMANIKNALISSVTGQGIDIVRGFLTGKINAFTGNSGVGKSTLLNYLFRDINLNLETDKISRKLGRGKHTTREVELFKVGNNSYVADTPGFSNLNVNLYEEINKENLQNYFTDFYDYIDLCKFNSCSHTCEDGCAVIDAVNNNKINRSRFNSYVAMYNELKDVKKWNNKKNI